MTPTNKCPRCGSGPYGGTSHYSRFECRTILWDDGTLRLESHQCRINQLTTKLATLEFAYAECSEKMKRFRSRWLAAHQELRKAEDKIERAEQREHDLRRRLESTTNHTTP